MLSKADINNFLHSWKNIDWAKQMLILLINRVRIIFGLVEKKTDENGIYCFKKIHMKMLGRNPHFVKYITWTLMIQMCCYEKYHNICTYSMFLLPVICFSNQFSCVRYSCDTIKYTHKAYFFICFQLPVCMTPNIYLNNLCVDY